MNEQNNLPAKLNMPPEQLTEPIIKAFFQKEISRKDYQQVLQNLENVKPTKENLPQVDKIMKDVNKVINELMEGAQIVGSPYFKAHKNILAAMKELLKPILTKVTLIEAEKKTCNDELLADLAKANAAKARIDNIRNTMTTFINNCTAFISTATTNQQIANVQKRIGTEKSREGFYGEYLPDLKDKCNALDTLINERKGIIRKQAELSAAAETALKNDDAEAAAEIREQQEQLESDMEENILRLQEKAFEQITNVEPIYVAEPVGEALKGRNYWRWEILDATKVYKKRPELIILEPNKEAIDKLMAENREGWNADSKSEVVMDGIKFFIKKFL